MPFVVPIADPGTTADLAGALAGGGCGRRPLPAANPAAARARAIDHQRKDDRGLYTCGQADGEILRAGRRYLSAGFVGSPLAILPDCQYRQREEREYHRREAKGLEPSVVTPFGRHQGQ
jgi:hypothetical protein